MPKKKKRATTRRKTKKKPDLKALIPDAILPRETVQDKLSMHGILTYGKDRDVNKKNKFRKEYVGMIQAHMEQGKRLNQFSRTIGIHYDTLAKWLNDPKYTDLMNAAQEGTWNWIQSLGPKLIKHMSEGRSFESFGSVANRSRVFLYSLAIVDEDFREAKELAYTSSMFKWEAYLQGQAAGTLVRLSSETAIENKKGQPIINPKTGEPMTNKKYVPSVGSSRALIFGLQLRFEEYRPDRAGANEEINAKMKGIMEQNLLEESRNIQGDTDD